MVHYHHFRVIALDVILLEVIIIVKSDPSQNSKAKKKDFFGKMRNWVSSRTFV